MNYHKFTLGVVNAILTDVEGSLVFGGFVRDNVRHNIGAQRFYQHPEYKNIQCQKERDAKYSDATFLPETKDRLLLAKDIDCFMRTADIKKLKAAFTKRGIEVIDIEDKPTQRYNLCGYRLTRMEVGMKMTPILMAVLSERVRGLRCVVDIVHDDDITGKEPPFNEIDFECNALIMDGSKQMRLSTRLFVDPCKVDPVQRMMYMNGVVDRLIDHKTYVGSINVAPWRIKKMISKGYELLGSDDVYSLKQCTNCEDMCILCLSNFDDKEAVLKRTCCSAMYHTKCFKEMVEQYELKNKCVQCPQCRNEMLGYELHRSKGLWGNCCTQPEQEQQQHSEPKPLDESSLGESESEEGDE